MSNNERKDDKNFFLVWGVFIFLLYCVFNCSGESGGRQGKGYIESLVKDGEYSSVREFEEAMRNDYVSDDR